MIRPLDLRKLGYSVFGKVTSGMDVLARLAVGDRILSITIH